MRRLLFRLALVALVFASLAAAYFYWFRDSSLVAVEKVRVEGVGGAVAQGEEIRAALDAAGREMTTLHVDHDRLRQAVADFPEVASIRTETGFPDSLTIEVGIRRPVARIGEGSEAVGVAEDGYVLPGASIGEARLPRLPLTEPPADGRVAGPVLDLVKTAAAAQPELLAVTESIDRNDEGILVTLISGIELRFGEPNKLQQKWQSAAAVLSDPNLQTLDYVDLSSPGRPSVGGTGHQLPAIP